MVAPHTAEILTRSPLLRDLPEEPVARLAAAARRRTYKRGEVIFHLGDPGDSLFILESGRVKVYTYAESGDETILSIIGPGECFGELALIDEQPRSATIQAMERVEALTIGRQAFRSVIREYPQAAEYLLRAMARRIRYLTEVVADLAFLDLDGRLAKRLLELAEDYGQKSGGETLIELRITQEELAAMVGATRASVNKLLGWYEDRGMIARRGPKIGIAVLQPDRLRAHIV